MNRSGRYCRIFSVVFTTVIFATGCLEPAVRYTRPSASASLRPDPRAYRQKTDLSYINSDIGGTRLEAIVRSYLGTPYRYGGTSRKGLDCSGLVLVVFRELCGAALPRTTRKLRNFGRTVPPSQARSGDLVFYRTGAFGNVNHVGIVLSGGRFAHASSKRGVVYDRLGDAYFSKRFAGIRRIGK